MIEIIHNWSWVILRGLANTVMLFLASACVTVIGAALVGAGVTYGSRVLRVALTAFIEIFRGTSAYVQLFWLYYALPLLGIELSVWGAAIWALGLNHAAYGATYVRGALESVASTQHEAATALGLRAVQRIRLVVAPQALLVVMPLFASEFVLLMKGTSIASLVTLPELTDAGRAIVGRTFQPIPAFAVVLTLYFCLAFAIVRLMSLAEGRIGRWRHGLARG